MRMDVGRSSPSPSSVPGEEGKAFHFAWGSVHLRPHEDLACGSKSGSREGSGALPGCLAHFRDVLVRLSISVKVANVTQPAWWADCLRAVAEGPAAEHTAQGFAAAGQQPCPTCHWLSAGRWVGQAEGSECC